MASCTPLNARLPHFFEWKEVAYQMAGVLREPGGAFSLYLLLLSDLAASYKIWNSYCYTSLDITEAFVGLVHPEANLADLIQVYADQLADSDVYANVKCASIHFLRLRQPQLEAEYEQLMEVG